MTENQNLDASNTAYEGVPRHVHLLDDVASGIANHVSISDTETAWYVGDRRTPLRTHGAACIRLTQPSIPFGVLIEDFIRTSDTLDRAQAYHFDEHEAHRFADHWRGWYRGFAGGCTVDVVALD